MIPATLRGTRALLAAAAAMTLMAVIAQAQTYPAKPIRLIMPWPPGGPAEGIARPVMDRLSQALGRPIVIEAKAGAAAMIGTQYVAKQPADGYTLLLSHVGSTTIAPALQKEMPYDAIKDFEHITLVASATMVLLVRPELPFKSIPELIAYAKSNPGKLAYGSMGTGSTSHLAGELFTMMAGINMLHVPYNGVPPVLQDLLGGRIQASFIGYLPAQPHAKSGRLRLIAIASSANRSPVEPDLPTVNETLPGYEADAWYGLAAPAGTPKEIVNRIYTEVSKVLRDPQVTAKLRETGSEPGGMPPDAFLAKIRQDTARWAKVVEAAHIAKQ